MSANDEALARLDAINARLERQRAAKAKPARKAKGLLQRDRILMLLQSTGAWLTSSEIDERLGLPEAAASKVMTHLVREGKVLYTDGLYAAVAA